MNVLKVNLSFFYFHAAMIFLNDIALRVKSAGRFTGQHTIL